MTPQEQQLVSGLIDRVSKTRLTEKDPEAEQMLNSSLGQNPDSLYILSQTVLVQQMALEQVQRQLAELRQQQAQPKKATSFLGSIFGTDEPARPAPPPPPQPGFQPVPNSGQGAGYGGPAHGGQGQYAPAGYGGMQSGGFLRGALQTATGVAAGALAFEGIESLLHGGFGGGDSRGFGDLGGSPREETINNYYGDSDRGDRGGDSSLSSDIEDRRVDAGYDPGDRFGATDPVDGSDDGGSSQDSAFADSSGDDFDSADATGDDGGVFGGGDDGGGFGGGDNGGSFGGGDSY